MRVALAIVVLAAIGCRSPPAEYCINYPWRLQCQFRLEPGTTRLSPWWKDSRREKSGTPPDSFPAVIEEQGVWLNLRAHRGEFIPLDMKEPRILEQGFVDGIEYLDLSYSQGTSADGGSVVGPVVRKVDRHRGGNLLVGLLGSGNLGRSDGRSEVLLAFDEETGQQRWSHHYSALQESRRFFPHPGWGLVESSPEGTALLRLDTGADAWRTKDFDPHFELRADPAGNILLETRSGLKRLDVRTGAVLQSLSVKLYAWTVVGPWLVNAGYEVNAAAEMTHGLGMVAGNEVRSMPDDGRKPMEFIFYDVYDVTTGRKVMSNAIDRAPKNCRYITVYASPLDASSVLLKLDCDQEEATP